MSLLNTGLYKVNGRSARVTPGHTRPPGRLPTRKNTQNQSLTSLQMEKNYVYVFMYPYKVYFFYTSFTFAFFTLNIDVLCIAI